MKKDGWEERKQLSCDLVFLLREERSASKLQRSSFPLMPNSVGKFGVNTHTF